MRFWARTSLRIKNLIKNLIKNQQPYQEPHQNQDLNEILIEILNENFNEVLHKILNHLFSLEVQGASTFYNDGVLRISARKTFIWNKQYATSVISIHSEGNNPWFCQPIPTWPNGPIRSMCSFIYIYILFIYYYYIYYLFIYIYYFILYFIQFVNEYMKAIHN